MKRVISYLLTITLLLTLAMPVAIAADERTSGAYTYRVKGNGTLAITGFDWANNNGDIYIPNMLDGYTISEISEEAFARSSFADNNAKDVVVVTLPNTITYIGDKAFFNSAIASIIIPASVEEIGVGAFAGCKNITRFSVASGNSTYTTIDDVLYNKKTKTLVAYPVTKELTAIPDGIVAIGDYAFYGKEFGDISQVRGGVRIAQHLPDSIKTIGNWAFANTKMHISQSDDGDGFLPLKIENIGEYAFYGCDILYTTGVIGRDFKFPKSLKTIGNHAFEAMHFRRHSERDSRVSESVGKLVFCGDNLNIGDYAFASSDVELVWNYGVSVSSSIEIVESASIGKYAFRDNLYTFHFLPEKIISFSEGSFKNIDVYSSYGKHLTIDGKYETIPKEAFRGGNNAGSTPHIILEEGIITIEEYAFADRKDLKEVKLPTTLTTIEEGAFSNCPSLKEALLPTSITQIGEKAFDRETISLTVEAGSYAERWARDNGYAYGYAESDDLSWLNN